MATHRPTGADALLALGIDVVDIHAADFKARGDQGMAIATFECTNDTVAQILRVGFHRRSPWPTQKIAYLSCKDLNKKCSKVLPGCWEPAALQL